jgi:hypothetical protein
MACGHFRSEGDSRQELFSGLVRPSQRVVQKRAEVGLDDVELALRDRNDLRQVVDDVGASHVTPEGRTGLASPEFRPRRGLTSACRRGLATACRGRALSSSVRAPYRESGFRLIAQAKISRLFDPRASFRPARSMLVSKANGSSVRGGQKTGVVSCDTLLVPNGGAARRCRIGSR